MVSGAGVYSGAWQAGAWLAGSELNGRLRGKWQAERAELMAGEWTSEMLSGAGRWRSQGNGEPDAQVNAGFNRYSNNTELELLSAVPY